MMPVKVLIIESGEEYFFADIELAKTSIRITHSAQPFPVSFANGSGYYNGQRLYTIELIQIYSQPQHL